MQVHAFIALRFMWEQRTQNALIITGVGVGLAVLVFLSALMSGLQASLIEKTTGSQPHIVVTPLEQEGRPLLLATPESPIAYLRRIERPVQRIQTIPEWQKLDRQASGLKAGERVVLDPRAAGK